MPHQRSALKLYLGIGIAKILLELHFSAKMVIYQFTQMKISLVDLPDGKKPSQSTLNFHVVQKS